MQSRPQLTANFHVEQSKVREFARAVHDDTALAEGIAPTTFPICVSAVLIERLLRDDLQLDQRYTVHGEQEYEYARPIRVGDRLNCRARVVQDYEKHGRRGGHMRFVVCETEMRDAATGELVVIERMTAIVTQPGEA